MSYYHHCFEMYVDRDTRSCNITGCNNIESLKRAAAADRIRDRIIKGNTLVLVTVKRLTHVYWQMSKAANQA